MVVAGRATNIATVHFSRVELPAGTEPVHVLHVMRSQRMPNSYDAVSHDIEIENLIGRAEARSHDRESDPAT